MRTSGAIPVNAVAPAWARSSRGTRMPGAPSPLASSCRPNVEAVPAPGCALNRPSESGLADRRSGNASNVSTAGQGGFAGSGVVGRYWQTRCRGFEVRSVRGRRLGTVESLELDRETATAAVLLVRRRRRRPLRVRPELVSVVDPWQRSLVVAVPPRRSGSRHAARGLARGVRTSGAHAVTMARWAVTIARGTRRLGPPVRRALAWAGPRALLAGALAVWLYALVVFTVVRLAAVVLRAVTVGTARGGAWLAPHLHGAK